MRVLHVDACTAELLEMEMNRVEVALHSDEEDVFGTTREDTLEEVASWLLRLWREERMFLQQHVPLIILHVFEQVCDQHEAAASKESEFQPIAVLLKTVNQLSMRLAVAEERERAHPT